MDHFIVHRHLSLAKDAIQIQDMIDEVLSMASIDNMRLISTIQFTDAAQLQHLYLIFERIKDEKKV